MSEKDFVERFSSGVNHAGEMLSDIFNISKLKLQIFDIKNDIGNLYREIGKQVYSEHANPYDKGTDLNGLFDQVTDKMAKVRELRQRITELKRGRRDDSGDTDEEQDGKDVCPHCGKRPTERD